MATKKEVIKNVQPSTSLDNLSKYFEQMPEKMVTSKTFDVGPWAKLSQNEHIQKKLAKKKLPMYFSYRRKKFRLMKDVIAEKFFLQKVTAGQSIEAEMNKIKEMLTDLPLWKVKKGIYRPALFAAGNMYAPISYKTVPFNGTQALVIELVVLEKYDPKLGGHPIKGTVEYPLIIE